MTKPEDIKIISILKSDISNMFIINGYVLFLGRQVSNSIEFYTDKNVTYTEFKVSGGYKKALLELAKKIDKLLYIECKQILNAIVNNNLSVEEIRDLLNEIMIEGLHNS